MRTTPGVVTGGRECPNQLPWPSCPGPSTLSTRPYGFGNAVGQSTPYRAYKPLSHGL
ncbi:hypothetical protein C8Q70DRAFT_653303 [Cubamyces menziesii]|nr:hypothetical protein C8Q70DRAFT_653303 [Cubamyces menziesii]